MQLKFIIWILVLSVALLGCTSNSRLEAIDRSLEEIENDPSAIFGNLEEYHQLQEEKEAILNEICVNNDDSCPSGCNYIRDRDCELSPAESLVVSSDGLEIVVTGFLVVKEDERLTYYLGVGYRNPTNKILSPDDWVILDLRNNEKNEGDSISMITTFNDCHKELIQISKHDPRIEHWVQDIYPYSDEVQELVVFDFWFKYGADVIDMSGADKNVVLAYGDELSNDYDLIFELPPILIGADQLDCSGLSNI